VEIHTVIGIKDGSYSANAVAHECLQGLGMASGKINGYNSANGVGLEAHPPELARYLPLEYAGVWR
jgi:hypothetical protein